MRGCGAFFFLPFVAMYPYNIAFLLIYQEKYNILPQTSRTHTARRTHSSTGP